MRTRLSAPSFRGATTDRRAAVFTREELTILADTNPTVLVDIVLALQEQVRILQQQVDALQKRVAELEARLNANSSNST
jgi:uncharacterized protein YlxW (UPF0749 family)